MRELTREEKDWLVSYCMEPENTELALAIGQIQPELKRKIVSAFIGELDESVKALEKTKLCGFQGESKKTKLEEKGLYPLFILKGQRIQIRLGVWGGGNFQVSMSAGTDLDHRWDEIIKGMGYKPRSNADWWFFEKGDIQNVALSTLKDRELRKEKIENYTDIFVRLVEEILKVPEA